MTPEQLDDIVSGADFGTATAQKRGRNPRWPYVPVIIHTGYQQQICGLAFATRDEAVACGERHIAGLRAGLRQKLLEPRYRALREQYGLPQEMQP